MATRLQFPTTISARRAGKKVCEYLLHAPHDISPRPRDTREAQAFVDYIKAQTGTLLVQEARNYREFIPYIENMAAGSTWQLSAGAAITDEISGAVIATGPGEASVLLYLTHFEKACEARERAVNQASFLELANAITLGQSSIEGFVNLLAERWNARHPESQIPDLRSKRVSLEDKIHEWYPRMTGNRLGKNSPVWQKFVALKAIRNDVGVHPKTTGYGISYRQLARRIDDFREGIALSLGQLHVRASYLTPEAIINAYYFPDVEIVTVPG